MNKLYERTLFLMKHKELKAEMLKNGKYSDIRKLDKRLYKDDQMSLNQQLNGYMHGEYDDMIDVVGSETVKKMALEDMAMAHELDAGELESYLQMKKAKHNQMTKLNKHIDFYIKNGDYDLIFATFTFDNNSLEMNFEYRRKKLLKSLKDCPIIDDYILNIDYGKKNEREHYHGLLFVKKGSIEYKFKKDSKCWYIENMPIEYNLGFTTFQKVGNDEKDFKKVSSYVSKLSLHALKVKQKRLIYKTDSPYKKDKKYKKLLFEKK